MYISIHAPLAGRDLILQVIILLWALFQSTRPLRGATWILSFITSFLEYFNPRAPCGARLASAGTPCKEVCHFNPRAPCGARLLGLQCGELDIYFNPRAPCGARPRNAGGNDCMDDFNPRTPCGVRRWMFGRMAAYLPISIHAPLAGCDERLSNIFDQIKISIHAPLAGCDSWRLCAQHSDRYFNPRTPCGVRRRRPRRISEQKSAFQSTHPLRGATMEREPQPAQAGHFNPRTPCGVRPCGRCTRSACATFQSTHPLRGATLQVAQAVQRTQDFNPRTPCGVRPPSTCVIQQHSSHISIHAPLAGCD